jgi:hypothetical protein
VLAPRGRYRRTILTLSNPLFAHIDTSLTGVIKCYFGVGAAGFRTKPCTQCLRGQQRQKMANWLDTGNAWIIYVLTVLILVGAVECGSLLARRQRARNPDTDADRFLSNLSTPSLGLLALMIGFTFAMSLSRFEARTAAVLDEAKAIGSAARLGRILAEPDSTEVTPLFKEYA